jgi:hypothetical protein
MTGGEMFKRTKEDFANFVIYEAGTRSVHLTMQEFGNISAITSEAGKKLDVLGDPSVHIGSETKYATSDHPVTLVYPSAKQAATIADIYGAQH